MAKVPDIHKVEPYLPDSQGLVKVLDSIKLEIDQRDRYAFHEKDLNRFRKSALLSDDKVNELLNSKEVEQLKIKLLLSIRKDVPVIEKAAALLGCANQSAKHGIIDEFSAWYPYVQSFQTEGYHRWIEHEQVRRRQKNVVGRVPQIIQNDSAEVVECCLSIFTAEIVTSWLEGCSKKLTLIEIERKFFNYMIDVQDFSVYERALKKLPISLLDDYVSLLESAILLTKESDKITGMEPKLWAKSSNGVLFFDEENPVLRNKMVKQNGMQPITPEAMKVWRLKGLSSTVIITDKMVEVAGCV